MALDIDPACQSWPGDGESPHSVRGDGGHSLSHKVKTTKIPNGSVSRCPHRLSLEMTSKEAVLGTRNSLYQVSMAKAFNSPPGHGRSVGPRFSPQCQVEGIG